MKPSTTALPSVLCASLALLGTAPPATITPLIAATSSPLNRPSAYLTSSPPFIFTSSSSLPLLSWEAPGEIFDKQGRSDAFTTYPLKKKPSLSPGPIYLVSNKEKENGEENPSDHTFADAPLPSPGKKPHFSSSLTELSTRLANSSFLFSSLMPEKRKDYRSSFMWPTGRKVPVVTPFSPPSQPWLSGHRGVDLAWNANSPIYAAGEGTIIYADKLADRYVISIQHKNGVRTTYEPVQPIVTKGDKVHAGQIIGSLQPEHCPDSSCLHWGAKNGNDSYINPLSLVETHIRLIE